MSKNGILPNYVWTILAAGLLYVVFSFTSRMAYPSVTYVSTSNWGYWPRGFWSGRPIAPHAGFPGPMPPHPGPHHPPQFPAHGPRAPGPLAQPGSFP